MLYCNGYGIITYTNDVGINGVINDSFFNQDDSDILTLLLRQSRHVSQYRCP